jgi:hypothetical protein
MKNIVFFVLVVTILLSCRTTDFLGKEKLLPEDYVQWVENKENGLRIDMEDEPYMYELQYQPIEYLVVRQIRSPQITSAALKEGTQKRNGLLYFTLKMWTKDGKGILSDKNLIIENKNSYLLSGLQNDMILLAGSDSLHCVMLHFESANNLIPYDQCVLAFEKPKVEKENLVFLLRTDKYKQGWLKITVKKQDIKNTPKLKTI